VKSSGFQASRLQFRNRLPTWSQSKRQTMLLIYDSKLLRAEPDFRLWSSGFAAAYAVQAGEGLKEATRFAGHLEKLMRVAQGLAPGEMTVVVVGGGSVTDFGGFFASVYKRGVRLVLIPSTWLAAIDSAHGGKTALNVAGVKNQVGSFYQADEIYLVRDLLFRQPEARAQEAAGELAKMALLKRGKLFHELSQVSDGFSSGKDLAKLLWQSLKPAISAKMAIVKQDPFEESGLRQILNLGHTFGHVLESQLGLAHGLSVAHGLWFALHWSHHRGYLGQKDYLRGAELLLRLGLPDRPKFLRRKLKRSDVIKCVKQDKKRLTKDRLQFVFLEKLGRPIRRPVSIEELVIEAKRQEWVR